MFFRLSFIWWFWIIEYEEWRKTRDYHHILENNLNNWDQNVHSRDSIRQIINSDLCFPCQYQGIKILCVNAKIQMSIFYKNMLYFVSDFLSSWICLFSNVDKLQCFSIDEYFYFKLWWGVSQSLCLSIVKNLKSLKSS